MTTRQYNKVARAEAEERTREALLDAAERAFFEDHWDEVRLETLADDAGVSKQTLLRHFGSKSGLLDAGYRRAFEKVREQRMSAPGDDPEAALENLIDHYEDVGDQALALASMRGTEEIERIGQTGREFHYAWIDHAFGAWLEPMPVATARRCRAALIAICDVHTWALLARDLGLPRREVMATLLTMIEPLLKGENE